jgi:hypothetical protein
MGKEKGNRKSKDYRHKPAHVAHQVNPPAPPADSEEAQLKAAQLASIPLVEQVDF